jgi:cystathionine beta-lyase
MAIRAFTKPGETVLIQRPVYYPFTEVILDNDRRVCSNGLVLDENSGSYGIDFADFEEKIVTENIRLFLLCNPHNPVGRVWSRGELEQLGEICLRHGCVVVSDEIHCDFTFPGHDHTAFAALSEAFRDNSIVCTAPSKSFNLAGLQISNIFIANRELHRRFRREVNATGYSQAGIAGIAACKAAYDRGGPWLAELKSYLTGNLSYLRERLQTDVPAVRLIEPQGTYLAWMDFRALVKNRAEADALITRKARLWLDDGEMFGPEGTGFQRMNFACPRAVLREAMDRLAAAV